MVCAGQGFSASSLLTFWAGEFFVAGDCPVACLAASLAFVTRCQQDSSRCDNQKCLHTFPHSSEEQNPLWLRSTGLGGAFTRRWPERTAPASVCSLF